MKGNIFGRMRNAKKQAQALYAQSRDYKQAVRTQLIAGIANTCYTLLMLDAQLDLSEQRMPDDFAVGVPLRMLSCRPDVRSAEHALESAFYGTNQARSAFYPSVTLSGSAGWTNDAGVMIINPGKFIASAVGSLVQPLFNRGQNIANLKIAKAQQEEARLSFEQTLLNAGAEVNDALTAYQTSRDKAELYEKQVEALHTTVRSTSLLMEHGTSTYLEVLTARQSLLSAELSQVANRFAGIQSVVNLYQALGGGQE